MVHGGTNAPLTQEGLLLNLRLRQSASASVARICECSCLERQRAFDAQLGLPRTRTGVAYETECRRACQSCLQLTDFAVFGGLCLWDFWV